MKAASLKNLTTRDKQKIRNSTNAFPNFDDIFSDNFMKMYTRYSSFKDFMQNNAKNLPGTFEDGNVIYFDEQLFSAFLKRYTNFRSWDDMYKLH